MLFLLASLALAGSIDAAPASHVLDGDVSEWTATPTFVLTGADQVGGADPVRSARDFEASVWLALDEEGLLIAARVRDDVDWTAHPDSEVVRSDHLLIRFSVDDADLPPVGFANQFGDFEVADIRDCYLHSESPTACAHWLLETSWHRAELETTFRSEVLLSGAQIRTRIPNGEVGIYVGDPSLPAPAYRRTSDGYELEVRLGWEHFPQVRRAVIDRLRVLVDAVDNDAGQARRETLLTSNKEARVADPQTWPELTVSSPVSLVSDLPILSWLVEKGYALAPEAGRRVRWARWFENTPVGYQYSPESDSPTVTSIDLAASEVLPHGGQGELVEVDFGSELGTRVFLIRDGALVSASAFGCAVTPVQHEGETWLREVCETLNSPYGSGACGACPAYSWGVTALRNGAFETIGGGFVSSAPYGGEIQEAVSKDPEVLGFRALQYNDEEDREEWEVEVWKYSPTTKKFEPAEEEGIELQWPSEPDSED